MEAASSTHTKRRALKFALVLVVVLLPLLPSVQTAAVRWVAGMLDGISLELEYVWLKPWGVEARGIQLSLPGLSLAVDELDVELALFSSLFGFRLDIDSVSASHIELQLQPAALPKSPGPVEQAAPFAGLAPIIRLPRWIAVRHLGIDGHIEILSAGGSVYSGPLQFSLADLRQGSEANLALDSRLEARRGGELLAAVRLLASASADVQADGSIPDLAARIEALPAMGRLANRSIHGDMVLALGSELEAWSFDMEGGAGARLLALRAEYDPVARFIGFDWNLEVPPGLVGVFMVGDAQAEITGSSRGHGQFDLNAPRLVFESLTDLQGDGWGAFDSRLAPWGKLALDADIRAEGWQNRWLAEQFDLSVKVNDGREVLYVKALQQVHLNLETPSMEPARWGEPALRLKLDKLPLSWLRDFDPARVFEGGELSGSLDIIPESVAHLRLDANKPLRASSIKLRAGARGPLPIMDIEVVPHARIEDGKFVASIDRLSIKSATGLDIRFKGNANSSVEDWPAIDFEGGISVRAPRLQANIRGLDALRGAARMRLDLDRLVLGVQTIGIDARSTSDTTYASLELKGDAPLELSLPGFAPDWDNYEPQELILRLNGLPMEWLGLYLPEIELRAGDAYGEIRAVAGRGVGFHLEAPEPFEIRGIEPYYRGNRLAKSVSARLTPRASLRTEGGSFALENIQLQSRVGDRLDGEISLDWKRDDKEHIAMALDFSGVFPSLIGRGGQSGVLHWTQSGSVNRLTGRTEIDKIDLSFGDIDGASIVEVTAIRPFSIAGNPLAFKAGGGSGHVLQATIRPLELQQLLPELGGFALEGSLPEGEFFGDIDGAGRLVIFADEPLEFSKVSVLWDDVPLLRALDVELGYEVAYSASGLEARSVDMLVRSSGGDRLGEFSLQAVAPLINNKMLRSLDVSLELALESLGAQPVMNGLPPLLAGSLAGKLKLVNDEAPVIRGRAALEGAVVSGQGPLPNLEVSLAVDGVRGKMLAVNIPVRMQSDKGLSSLEFSGEAQRSDPMIDFEASLSGEEIIMADVRRLYEYLMQPGIGEEPAEPEAASTTDAQKPGMTRTAVQQLRLRRDRQPFWTDKLRGTASIDIARIRFPHYAVEGVGGRLQLTPDTLTLSSIEASMLDARLSSAGAIHFEEEKAEPYDMNFTLELTDLQIGEFLRSVEPDKPPVVEGMFSLSTDLSAVGRNALDLGLASQGEIRLSGRDGVFRGLAGSGGAASTAAGAVGILTFSKELKAIGRILDKLESLHFSQLSAALVRESPALVELRQLQLVAPGLRLQGEGWVTMQKQGSLLDSPLRAEVDLATRQDMTILFDGMGLLREQADAQGYRSLTRTLQFTGTLAEPDTADLWEMLDEAAENSRGFFGMGLRTINRKIHKQQARQAQQ